MVRWPSANVFLLKAARAALDCSALGAVDREPEWEPFEIAEKRDFTSRGVGRGEAGFTILNTLAFMTLSSQILSKKAC